MYDRISFFGMPIKTFGSLGKIRVSRVTGNTHIFFWPKYSIVVVVVFTMIANFVHLKK